MCVQVRLSKAWLHRSVHVRARFACAMVGATLFSGCATYSPLPLGEGHSAQDVSHLTVNAADMPLPALREHRFDPSKALDSTDIAMLAVANNPDLRTQRDQLGIARAQVFEAGLLPDPQISAGKDFLAHRQPGFTSAYNLGISEDVTSLLLRSTRKAAAKGQAEQVNLDLLWAEWQTVAQSRLLFNQVISLRAQYAQLAGEQRALAPVDVYVRKALQEGNLTYDSASAGLNAYADASKRLSDCAIQQHQAEHDLRVLLGLAPNAPLDLIDEPYTVSATPDQIAQALDDLPHRRPDLLALQAGYQAQEDTLRGAIRAQFPALTLGVDRQRDTSDVLTNGFTIGLTLPLFDRNRGNIAIEKATRQQLKDDYEGRVLTTRNDIQQLMADSEVLQRQYDVLKAQSRRLDEARDAAEVAWQKGLLDWPTYLSIRANALSADMDFIAARDLQWQQAIALETLLGSTQLQASNVTASTP
jgi:outer membrane protein, heavy metal efflux system